MTEPTESEVLSWFEHLSNWGRWGAEDELGTLNLVTPAVRRRAAQLVKDGLSVSCAHEVVPGMHNIESELTAVSMAPGTRLGFSTEQITALTVHGYVMTHLDALSHIFWDGQMYNGRSAEVLASGGVNALPITVARHGAVTRGVLLDVAAAKGVEWLEPGQGAFPEDLEAAEARQGVRVEPGDAVLLRTGFGRFRREMGSKSPSELGSAHPGWHAAALPWLRERDVAIIGCDSATDAMPSGYRNVVLPVHTVGIVAMGLWLIDNCDLEELAAVASSSNRWEFQLSICPLALAGLTSSPVNPIATF
ncbi:MAG TPA: cyclase family protein [Acidimicrobiales bacterium]|nr:cyclase family protein [Acidimicrobiales bacterium]